MTTFLVSPEQILKGIARERPEAKVDQIIDAIGETAAFSLLEKMAGQTVNFPSVSTLQRVNKSVLIQKELGRIRDDSNFGKTVKKLSKMLSMSRPAVIRTFARRKYCE